MLCFPVSAALLGLGGCTGQPALLVSGRGRPCVGPTCLRAQWGEDGALLLLPMGKLRLGGLA